MKIITLTICIIITAFNIAISQNIVSKDLSCKEAFELIQEHRGDPNFVIIDLRPEKMYNEEHIENAIFFDVFSDQFDGWANSLDKDKVYLLYCTIGQRSKMGLEKMKSIGFKNLYHMYEGIRVWKSQGYQTIQKSSEIALVEKAINNVFGWAINKDFELFFNTIADDSNFVSVTPYKRVKFGAQAVKNDTAFWASPNFKAIRHELHNLKINFSSGGDVAWFYCVLDDINTWKGEPANWEKVRWTGVLEKRNGKWRVVQQHFSWPNEE
ncbi:MAG: hypothetical protein A2V66_15925 [Ignavibacteria bacterium RBG_13_36_8]|nr:MAG: hypothetical protein A2V66_15925 [Ignavibacteria bacterium RBG_13_36_8]